MKCGLSKKCHAGYYGGYKLIPDRVHLSPQRVYRLDGELGASSQEAVSGTLG